MRKVCVFLCLSFFFSLIHAASMPVFVPDHGHEHQSQSASHADHSGSHAQHKQCDDCSPSLEKVAKKAPAKCHTSAQCCFGVANLTSSTPLIAPLQYAENLSAYPPTLAVGQSLDGIYKPPRT